MEKSQLQQTVESLKHQLNIARIPLSEACYDLKDYCQRHINADPLITPVDKKDNPWAEKKTCAII
ncbi:guanine nucleotide-binding protein subunit gamma-e-like [Xenia sp. Carnegie-2017]|uniref:guanine nucleotide-binding protein subunit gamma-e-like n=1 Tax=Xenia sp. Carnegie-2017 TaxID=2897299 RepID=UPI001F04E9EE|nr:guanine nucleotide-binding protein subunit gamma-e-like [Xenia sp. Carnegie-2017]